MEQLALVHVLGEDLVLQVHFEHLQDLVDVFVETLELLEVRVGNGLNGVGYCNLDHSKKARDLTKQEMVSSFCKHKLKQGRSVLE